MRIDMMQRTMLYTGPPGLQRLDGLAAFSQQQSPEEAES